MPRARARRVRRRYNAVVLETNRQTGKVYCLILFCGGSPINRQARNDGSVGYCRPPLRRFALIPRQARNDGSISISFLYISNQVLLYAKLPKLLSFISYLLSKSPHHFDRSERQRAERRNPGVSRTKHSLDFCRVWALTVYCVCTRIIALR